RRSIASSSGRAFAFPCGMAPPPQQACPRWAPEQGRDRGAKVGWLGGGGAGEAGPGSAGGGVGRPRVLGGGAEGGIGAVVGGAAAEVARCGRPPARDGSGSGASAPCGCPDSGAAKSLPDPW